MQDMDLYSGRKIINKRELFLKSLKKSGYSDQEFADLTNYSKDYVHKLKYVGKYNVNGKIGNRNIPEEFFKKLGIEVSNADTYETLIDVINRHLENMEVFINKYEPDYKAEIYDETEYFSQTDYKKELMDFYKSLPDETATIYLTMLDDFFDTYMVIDNYAWSFLCGYCSLNNDEQNLAKEYLHNVVKSFYSKNSEFQTTKISLINKAIEDQSNNFQNISQRSYIELINEICNKLNSVIPDKSEQFISRITYLPTITVDEWDVLKDYFHLCSSKNYYAYTPQQAMIDTFIYTLVLKHI